MKLKSIKTKAINECLDAKMLSRAKKIQEDVVDDMFNLNTEPSVENDTNITIDDKPIEKKAIDLISDPVMSQPENLDNVEEGEEEIEAVGKQINSLSKEDKRALLLKLAKGFWGLDDIVNELSGMNESYTLRNPKNHKEIYNFDDSDQMSAFLKKRPEAKSWDFTFDRMASMNK